MQDVDCDEECNGEATSVVCGHDCVDYDNLCQLECQGAVFFTNGSCDTTCCSQETGNFCNCSQILNVLCGEDCRNYVNQDALDWMGVALKSEGACPEDCVDSLSTEVCSDTEKTSGLVCDNRKCVTYLSRCLAKINGARDIGDGSCTEECQVNVCNCETRTELVCGDDCVTYQNRFIA